MCVLTSFTNVVSTPTIPLSVASPLPQPPPVTKLRRWPGRGEVSFGGPEASHRPVAERHAVGYGPPRAGPGKSVAEPKPVSQGLPILPGEIPGPLASPNSLRSRERQTRSIMFPSLQGLLGRLEKDEEPLQEKFMHFPF